MEIPHSLSATEIIAKLQELTQGLYYQSESDYPLEIVQYTDVLPDPLTQEAILALTGNPLTMPVEVTDVASFFRHVTKPDYLTEKANSSREQVAALQVFCEQQLPGAQVYRFGRRTVTALLLGKIPEGKLLGLKTTIIQT